MADAHHHYPALPADGYTAAWQTWDGAGSERFTLRWENEAWTATGQVSGADVEYVLRISPLWEVRQLLLFRDLADPDLWLGTDGHGRWGEVNGVHRPELAGASDVTLAVTPSTHAVPIRRLGIAIGESAAVSALAVDVETLAVTPLGLRYARLDGVTWVVTGGESSIRFEVDAHGIPGDLPGVFRRTA